MMAQRDPRPTASSQDDRFRLRAVELIWPGYESRDLEAPEATVMAFPVFELTLRGKRVALRRPIQLELSRDEEWFAENHTLGLFGAGPNPCAAISDFLEHLEEYATHYDALTLDDVDETGAERKRVFAALFPPKS